MKSEDDTMKIRIWTIPSASAEGNNSGRRDDLVAEPKKATATKLGEAPRQNQIPDEIL